MNSLCIQKLKTKKNTEQISYLMNSLCIQKLSYFHWNSTNDDSLLYNCISNNCCYESFYKRAYGEIFLTSDATDKLSAVADDAGRMLDYHRFGWLLFLVLRVRVFGRFKDLVTSTNGLLSILVSSVPLDFNSFKL